VAGALAVFLRFVMVQDIESFSAALNAAGLDIVQPLALGW
jgi:hypothetical protein